MAELRQNTWTLGEWYDQDYAGNVSYSGAKELYAWGPQGTTNYGQHGLNNTVYTSSPTQVGTDTTWSTVSGAYYAAYGVKTDGTLWAWGSNESGALGLNQHDAHRSSPTQIPGTTWSSPLASGKGLEGACTKTDGTLWVWGMNEWGQLGQNNRTSRSSPVQVPGLTWSSVSGTYKNMIATKTDGTLWSWGYNGVGALGHNQGSSVRYSSPVQIPGTTWGVTRAGANGSWFNIKTDGTLWACGNGGGGQLAQNSRTHRSSPVQIPGSYKTFSNGYYAGHAIKTDGTLWSWGYNEYGFLGQNDRVRRSSPVQVPGTNWSSVQGGWAVLATKTDGTLWSMGRNEGYVPAGQGGGLGLNDAIHRSSPTQIPGTWMNELPYHTSRGGVFAFKEL